MEVGLMFNGSKTQLVCFHKDGRLKLPDGCFHFFGQSLCFQDSVIHLGCFLSSSLNDDNDIKRVVRDMCRRANCMLHTFSPCDPQVKTKLLECFCLPLFGAVTWSFCSKSLKALEIAFNNILRKIWRLPRQCHTCILHLVAEVPSLINKIVNLSSAFLRRVSSSDCQLIKQIFTTCSKLAYTPTGFNNLYQDRYLKNYSEDDALCAAFVRDLRLYPKQFDMDYDSIQDTIFTICCS